MSWARGPTFGTGGPGDAGQSRGRVATRPRVARRDRRWPAPGQLVTATVHLRPRRRRKCSSRSPTVPVPRVALRKKNP